MGKDVGDGAAIDRERESLARFKLRDDGCGGVAEFANRNVPGHVHDRSTVCYTPIGVVTASKGDGDYLGRPTTPPAASLACPSADLIPSVTKWNVVPPAIFTGSRA
jgi:hypothetical protein